jgi:hypothetical protein
VVTQESTVPSHRQHRLISNRRQGSLPRGRAVSDLVYTMKWELDCAVAQWGRATVTERGAEESGGDSEMCRVRVYNGP